MSNRCTVSPAHCLIRLICANGGFRGSGRPGRHNANMSVCRCSRTDYIADSGRRVRSNWRNISLISASIFFRHITWLVSTHCSLPHARHGAQVPSRPRIAFGGHRPNYPARFQRLTQSMPSNDPWLWVRSNFSFSDVR